MKIKNIIPTNGINSVTIAALMLNPINWQGRHPQTLSVSYTRAWFPRINDKFAETTFAKVLGIRLEQKWVWQTQKMDFTRPTKKAVWIGTAKGLYAVLRYEITPTKIKRTFSITGLTFWKRLGLRLAKRAMQKAGDQYLKNIIEECKENRE